MQVRLNKYISQSGICSRRKADELIKKGKAKVNGEIIKDLGVKINPEKDIVEVEGNIIKPVEKKIYIKIYKPVGYLSAVGKDKFGRKTLTDLLKELNIKESLFPVGRLDYNSEGLLILTNDGEFANKIAHPKHEVKKVYHVEIVPKVYEETLNQMKKGAILEDDFLKPDKVKILKHTKDSTWLLFEIHSGKKRILRRYVSKFNYKVRRLIRVKINSISIENLKPHQFKHLTDKEVKSIYERDSIK
jgi:23S rRNA pseudouridine2605 synthase